MWPIIVLSILCFNQVMTLPTTSASIGDEEDTPMGSEVSSPLHVAQCRATCLQQVLTRDSQGDCSKTMECSDCWRKCEMLEKIGPQNEWLKSGKNLKTICSTSSCTLGCQVACGFHLKMNQQQKTPVVATRNRNVLRLSPVSGTSLVQWPEQVDLTDSPLVYVLIQQLPHLKWRQVTQTTQKSALMPKTLWEKLDFGLRSVRVLVVSPQGLVAILHPENKVGQVTTTSTEPPSSPTSESSIEEIARTWSKMMKVDESYPPPPIQSSLPKKEPPTATEDVPITTTDTVQENEEDIWELRTLSLIHQKSLVIAELSWNPVKYSQGQEYLITWELNGGGLKGHLVTETTVVSLSLWPNTLYNIQVELFEPSFEEGEQEGQGESPSLSKSLPLTVDTSEASFPLLEKPSALSSQQFITASTLVAVCVSVLLVFGILLVAISLRRLFSIRGTFSPEKQLLQDTDDEEKNSASPLRRPCSFPASHGDGVAVISGSLMSDLKMNKGPSIIPPPNLCFPTTSPSQSHHHVHLVPWWHTTDPTTPQRARVPSST